MRPVEGVKKGADRGIDGRLYFHDDNSGKSKQIIFSVKGGRSIGVAEVRDLIGLLDREKAEIGVYVSFEEPTNRCNGKRRRLASIRLRMGSGIRVCSY